MDNLYERTLERLGVLEDERDKFVAQANAQLAAYNVCIAELQKLLTPPEPEQDSEADEE